MAKKERCCGENNILRYLMYGVFKPPVDPCCQDLTTPFFGDVNSNSYDVFSFTPTYGNAGCTYTLEVKFETTGNWHSGSHQVEFYDGTNYVFLTRNQWYSFTYNPDTSGTMQCTLYNYLYPTEGKCIMLHFKNHTCNLNYGVVSNLCSVI